MKKFLVIAPLALVALASILRVELVAQESPEHPQAKVTEAPPAVPPTQPTPEVAPSPSQPATAPVAPVQPTPSDSPYIPERRPRPPITDLTEALKDPTISPAAEKMIKAAEESYEANLAAYTAQMSTMEGVPTWSLRWMQAVTSTLNNPYDPRHLEAAEAHLRRMLSLHEHVASLYKIGSQGGGAEKMKAADYFVAQAEQFVEQAKLRVAVGGLSFASNSTYPSTTHSTPQPVEEQTRQFMLGAGVKSAPAATPSPWAHAPPARPSAPIRRETTIARVPIRPANPNALVATIRSQDRMRVGETATFTIEVTNQSEVTIDDIHLAVKFDPAFEPQNGSAAFLLGNDKRISWKIESLKPGAKAQQEIVCRCLQVIPRAEIRVLVSAEGFSTEMVTQLGIFAADDAAPTLGGPRIAPTQSGIPTSAMPQPTPKLADASKTSTQLSQSAVPAAASKLLLPSAQAPAAPSSTRPQLNYNGRSFETLRDDTVNGLDSNAQLQGLKGLKQFALNGYSKEVAEAVMTVMRGYSCWAEIYELNPGYAPDSSWPGFIADAARETLVACEESADPLILKTLKEGTRNQRFFAITVLPLVMPSPRDAVERLLAETHDPDPKIRQLARSYAALADYRSKEVREALRTGLAQPDEDVLNTITIIRGQTRPAKGLPKPTAFWMLIPEVADLLSDQVPSTEVREAVNQALANFDALDRNVRLTALNEAAATATGQRAEWIRKKIAEVQAPPPAFVPPAIDPYSTAPSTVLSPPIAASGTQIIAPLSTSPYVGAAVLANPPAPFIASTGELRYEGKTFSQWADQLRTELSPAGRVKALYALAEFAAIGQGRAVAELVFADAGRTFTLPDGLSVNDPIVRSNQQLTEAALAAAHRVPSDELLPLATKALSSDSAQMRFFGLETLPLNASQDVLIPLLVTAMNDKDRTIAWRARGFLAKIDHDNQQLVERIRKDLKEESVEVATGGIMMAAGMEGWSDRNGQHQIAAYKNLLPDVLACLDHSDASVRELALKGVQNMALTSMDELEAIAHGDGPQAVNARKMLDKRMLELDRRK